MFPEFNPEVLPKILFEEGGTREEEFERIVGAPVFAKGLETAVKLEVPVNGFDESKPGVANGLTMFDCG